MHNKFELQHEDEEGDVNPGGGETNGCQMGRNDLATNPSPEFGRQTGRNDLATNPPNDCRQTDRNESREMARDMNELSSGGEEATRRQHKVWIDLGGDEDEMIELTVPSEVSEEESSQASMPTREPAPDVASRCEDSQ